jgi:predicted GNAT family N-acyltransferase
MIQIKHCKNKKELEDAKLVRKQVFVVEQNIDSEIESVGDEKCDHFVAYSDNLPVGGGRINYSNPNTAKIERMAVLKNSRGSGIGGKILGSMINFSKNKEGINCVILDAQYHAKGFYEKYGFQPDGEIFEEVGLPHIKMKLVL